MTLYDIKPQFQNLLRPLVLTLYEKNITANQVTLAALAGSIVIGVILMVFPHRYLFIVLPVFLFIRMALNAIDGMLARECNQKSHLGALLNELSDIVSDMALYSPFLFLNPSPAILILLTLLAIILTEFCGVLVQTIGAKRRYDGPLGKSDRAFVFGAYAVAVVFWDKAPDYLWVLFTMILLLSVYTCFNRCRKGLIQAKMV